MANIQYFVAKNDISFMKFLILVDLVARKGILNFESFYVKDYYQEFISARGEISVISIGSRHFIVF